MTLARLSIAALAFAALGACATQQPQTCSAEWISARSQAAFDNLRLEAGDDLDTLLDFAKSFDEDGAPTGPLAAFRLMNAVSSLETVAETFVEQTKPDLELIAQECDDPQLMADAFSDFLRDEGAPDSVIDLIATLGDIAEDLDIS
ncbi:MAG: hypothetical protein AAF719_10030 [Pseudomonadota bacterium]